MANSENNDALYILRAWVSEVESHYNDGWARAHFLNKIMEVKRYVDENLTKYDNLQPKVAADSVATDISGLNNE